MTTPPVMSMGVAIVVSPPAWKSGIGLSCLAPGPGRHSAMFSVCQLSVLTVVIAPLGRPVVPDVCRTCVGSSIDRSVLG